MNETESDNIKYNIDVLPYTPEENETIPHHTPLPNIAKPKRDSLVYIYIFSLTIFSYSKDQK